jgi:hypothetical protein
MELLSNNILILVKASISHSLSEFIITILFPGWKDEAIPGERSQIESWKSI